VIHSGDQTRFLPSERAMATAFGVGMQRLIFGHIHRHARGPFLQGVYHVLPAFDVEGVGLVVGANDWQPMCFRSGPGQAVAVAVAMPPACAWST
jgi:hypothetical protein